MDDSTSMPAAVPSAKRLRTADGDTSSAVSIETLVRALSESGPFGQPLNQHYTDLLGLASGILQAVEAHAELIFTHTPSTGAIGGRGGPIEGVPVTETTVQQGLLLILTEIVTRVGAARERSGRIRHQVLAWLLADVMGQREPWAADVALVIGKRLLRSMETATSTRLSFRDALVAATTALTTAHQANDAGATVAARDGLHSLLMHPIHSSISELRLPSDEAPMATAALALLSAGGGEGKAASTSSSLAAVMEAIPTLTQAELCQVVYRAQQELQSRG